MTLPAGVVVRAGRMHSAEATHGSTGTAAELVVACAISTEGVVSPCTPKSGTVSAMMDCP
jgi:hypothetical protein